MIRRVTLRATLLVFLFQFLLPLICQGQEAEGRSPKPNPEGGPRRGARTMGGKQFWTDLYVFRDWRIQKNALTGHCRLLDDQDLRQTWGSYDHCLQTFQAIRRQRSLPPLKSRAVVTIHGLGRTRQSMDPVGQAVLQAARVDDQPVEWINMSYASTRGDMTAHAEALDQVLRGLAGVEEVDFVAHSLGNLVIRRWLHLQTERQDPPADLPRVGRIVMLAPPNGGAEMAQRLNENGLFHFVLGTSGTQLAREWELVQQKLTIPQTSFGIIAGDVQLPKDGNPLIEGPDDLVVSVEETKLSGADDMYVGPFAHTYIMDQEKVHEAILRFLKHGYFLDKDRQTALE